MKTITKLFLIILTFNSISIYSHTLQAKTSKVDITKYLPSNFVKDGSIDYTSYIQKGLDENRDVIMPNFTILINEKGLRLKSNSNIYFQNKSKLIMKPNYLEAFSCIWILNCKNVKIYNPFIVGDRKKHLGEKGEWGMGIHITQSNHIAIYNPNISDCWGDGIYIGGGNKPSSNVLINDAVLINNRRNGMSLTNAVHITINNPTIERTNGTLPMAGIDIEPNNSSNEIDNITINNPRTIRNKKYGILIELNYMVSKFDKKVNITINDHLDEFSGKPLAIAKIRGNKIGKKTLLGNIKINNARWYIPELEEIDKLEQVKLLPKIDYINIQRYKSKSNKSL